MNKKTYAYKTPELDELKKEVTSKLGKEILSHDVVIELVVLLKNKLSTQTIKRVFGLIKDGTNPSIYTLNIISSFIGYKNWQSFLKNKTQETVDDELDINKEKLNYFYEVTSEDFWNNYYLNAKKQAQQTYKLINSTNDVDLYKALAKNHYAQQNLFEFFPDFNTLTSNFKIGLTHYLNFKKNNEAQIYGLCLLCLGAYLNENRIIFNKYYQNLSEIPEDYNIHPTVIGRRASIDVLYLLINDKDTIILEEKLSSLFKNYTGTVSIPNLQFITFEHLLIA